jgi:hypothetical protein
MKPNITPEITLTLPLISLNILIVALIDDLIENVDQEAKDTHLQKRATLELLCRARDGFNK